MNRTIPWLTGLVVMVCAAADAGQTQQSKPAYEVDPAVVRQLDALGENTSAWLPQVRVEGLPEAHQKNGWLNRGPFTRGYCNKMAYAPDRRTAFYCGQDHNLPHYNDCWEFHLGSNTWHCLTPPDGGNQLSWSRAWGRAWGRRPTKDPKKLEEARAFATRWLKENATFENGYMQTRKNGGPVMAWHTWDALSYDPVAGRMLWAVLDDQQTQQAYLKRYCTALGKDYDAELKKLKPGMGLWFFDPKTRRWSRWLGDGPHPRMRGMGGSLTYIPDLKRTLWYCGASNVSGGDHQMWSWDAKTNAWTDLKPNGGKGVFKLVVEKQAPSSEVQMAYGPRHRKLVAVLGKDTFLYDVAANAWSHAVADEANHAHDNRTVFAYDTAADAFLLLQPAQKNLRAYSLATNKWETLQPRGAEPPATRVKGYYDPVHNVLIATDKGKVWVYRYKRAKAQPAGKAEPSKGG